MVILKLCSPKINQQSRPFIPKIFLNQIGSNVNFPIYLNIFHSFSTSAATIMLLQIFAIMLSRPINAVTVDVFYHGGIDQMQVDDPEFLKYKISKLSEFTLPSTNLPIFCDASTSSPRPCQPQIFNHKISSSWLQSNLKNSKSDILLECINPFNLVQQKRNQLQK